MNATVISAADRFFPAARRLDLWISPAGNLWKEMPGSERLCLRIVVVADRWAGRAARPSAWASRSRRRTAWKKSNAWGSSGNCCLEEHRLAGSRSPFAQRSFTLVGCDNQPGKRVDRAIKAEKSFEHAGKQVGPVPRTCSSRWIATSTAADASPVIAGNAADDPAAGDPSTSSISSVSRRNRRNRRA